MFAFVLLAFSSTAQSGYALSFAKANSQYITVPHSSSINIGATATIEAVVNVTSGGTIIDKGNYNFLWNIGPNGMGFFTLQTNSWVYSTVSIPLGVTTHVAITISGGMVTFYTNGVASGTFPAAVGQGTDEMNIGRQEPTGCKCWHFDGTMDEVRIWNLARTQAQIQANMSNGVPSNSAGLVAYYKFDEGTGTTTADATANGNTGTLVNGPTWVPSAFQYKTAGSFSYTVPAGVQSISVKLWGGGGAAGHNCTLFSGGGGAFVQSKPIPVTAGQVYTVFVGNGGNLSTQSGQESSISLGGTKLIGASGGTMRYGAAPSTGTNVDYSYGGGNAGTNLKFIQYDFEDNFYGGGGASGGTGGTGGNGANGSEIVYAAGGLAVGEGGNGGKAGRTTFCSTATVPPFGSTGNAPGGGGGAPFVAGGLGSGGVGRVTISQCYNPGTIIGHTTPFPYELSIDSVYNGSIGSTQSAPYTWQQSTNNTTWTLAPGGITSRSYPLQGSNPPDEIFYRRNEAGCGVSSNTARVRIFTQGNGQLNGIISGKVFSRNGVTGVDGITITIQKTIALLGSPITKTYTAVTAGGGLYEIQGIFYGDLNNGDPTSVGFTVTPTKEGHRFNVQGSTDTIATPALTNLLPTKTGINFTDNTVYAVNGRVTQICSGCIAGFTTDSLDSVRVNSVKLPSNDPGPQSYTGDNGFGGYGITLTDPGNYKITPGYRNHTFTPTEQNVTVTNGDVNSINFVDNTIRTISGVIRAGGNQIIGTATLEFTDTVNGKTGPKFKKQVTTAADGSYSISLPARRYKMQVISFNPNAAGSDIPQGDLFTFFNVIRKDSTISNLDSFNKTLNLVYHRKPVLQIIGLADTTCGSYVVFHQGRRKNFTVNIWEGNPVHNVKLASDSADSIKVILVTSVQGDDLNDSLRYNIINGVTNITLLPGYPNIIAPYHKYFSLIFTDRYGRRAEDINRQTVVLGVKSDPGSFATVSPEIPLLILHDPPGDLSFSSWEQSQSAETAMRFSTLKNTSFNAWIEAKLGVDLILGLGVSYNTKFWASINANFGVSATINEANEAIVSVSNSQSFSTSDNSIVTGDQGDVYVGAALNLLYSVGHELKYTNACTLGIEDRLMIADSGFATKYVYSESHIVKTEIPRLQLLANNTTGAQKANFENQINVWRQVLANNAANKARAAFDKNISFDGTSGPITESTTASTTKSQTVEFNLEISTEIAIQLGLEIAGSGISGGVNIGFRMETGESKTTTATKSTTVSYTIDDDDDGDNFTVDVKKDPVYGTPVFVLVAGSASCPDEPIAQKRDNAQLLIPSPIQRDIPPANEAIFELQIGNTSESMEDRTYLLSFDQGSNPFPAATVTLNNTPTIGIPIPIFVPYGQSVSVTAGVKRNQAGSLFSYEGLRFVLTDPCGGSLNKVSTLSAYFSTPCSQVNIVSPLSNWRVSSANNNSLPLQLGGYTTANLQSISLEHSNANVNSWTTDTTVFQGQIMGSTTAVTWKTGNLPDGIYDLRAKVTCTNGTTYSQRVTGVVDRTAPIVFGNPEPTDDSYVTGDVISYTYNENIETGDLLNKVELRRMSNNAIIPVQVGRYQNKVMIVPAINIASFTGDTVRLIMLQIADVYGNARAEADTTYFVIGASVPATNPLVNLSSNRRAMNENAFDSLEFRFTLPSSVNYNRQINYIVSGTATYGADYSVRYPSGQPPTTTHNGVQGTITVVKNTTLAVLRIKPVADSEFEPNETITVSLVEGGNYSLGTTLSLTDTIRNDDIIPPVVYKSGPVNICLGQTLTLSTDATIDGQPVYAYQWKNGTAVVGSNPTLNVTASGIYRLTVFTQSGLTGVSEPVEVSVSNAAGPSLGADVNVALDCYGETKNITGVFNTTGFTASWNTATPTAAPPGVYRLVAANNAGCTDTAYVNVLLEVATWTGAVSSDWDMGGNWSTGAVPTATTHVIIASGTPNSCIVGTANASAASVQNRTGSTLVIINNRTLFVGGKCATLPPN